MRRSMGGWRSWRRRSWKREEEEWLEKLEEKLEEELKQGE